MLILFLLKILEKLVFITYGLIMLVLCKVKIQMIILDKFLKTSLKKALNHGLVFLKVHRVIQFNQKDWLKPYIDMNTELRKKTKNDFEKERVLKRKRELNYHTRKWFSEDLLAIEMKKSKSKNE